MRADLTGYWCYRSADKERNCAGTFLSDSRRHGHSSALGYIDIDGFKGVNDSFGHSAGDEILKAVGCALTKRLRFSDLGARLGGDEFAILLPETSMLGARSFFKDLHAALLDLAESNNWPLGFSVGVAVFPVPPLNSDEAIRLADDLMYRVKRSERNSVLFSEFDFPLPLPGSGYQQGGSG